MKPLSIGGKVLLALLVLGAGFAAFADTDWAGYGTGEWGGLHPFYIWQGTLQTDNPPNYIFQGNWGGQTSNTISSYPNYNSGTGRYEVGLSAANKGTWYQNYNFGGYYTGYYKPSADTADGYWWYAPDSSNANGTWWGTLAD